MIYHVIWEIVTRRGDTLLKPVDIDARDHEDAVALTYHVYKPQKNRVRLMKVGKGKFKPGMYPEFHELS